MITFIVSVLGLWLLWMVGIVAYVFVTEATKSLIAGIKEMTND